MVISCFMNMLDAAGITGITDISVLKPTEIKHMKFIPTRIWLNSSRTLHKKETKQWKFTLIAPNYNKKVFSIVEVLALQIKTSEKGNSAIYIHTENIKSRSNCATTSKKCPMNIQQQQ